MSWASEGRRPRILIVEDDPIVLELVTTRLDIAGFQTFFARNGREGLNRIRDLRPDGLVLDINMPVLDGFEVLAHLKSLGAYYPPTMVLTARNKPEDIKAAIAMGARDFLAKPFKDDQLIARVGRLVRKPVRSYGQATRPISKDWADRSDLMSGIGHASIDSLLLD